MVVVLVPFHQPRFAAPFVAARDAVAEGRVGTVTGVRAAFGHSGPADLAPGASWFFAATGPVVDRSSISACTSSMSCTS